MAPLNRRNQKQQSTQSQSANELPALNEAILKKHPSNEETKEVIQSQQQSDAAELNLTIEEYKKNNSDGQVRSLGLIETIRFTKI